MAEIINLRQARKRKARIAAEQQAAANRAKFGQSKAERTAHEMEQARLDRAVDGARIELGPEG